MIRVLHVVTCSHEEVAEEIISAQRADAELNVEVVDLQGIATPDYRGLLEKVFAADSVTIW